MVSAYQKEQNNEQLVKCYGIITTMASENNATQNLLNVSPISYAEPNGLSRGKQKLRIGGYLRKFLRI